jgi:hypothetical protein
VKAHGHDAHAPTGTERPPAGAPRDATQPATGDVRLTLATEDAIGCRRCTNDTRNPTVRIEGGLCQICRQFDRLYDRAELARELEFIVELQGSGAGRHDAMVGMSGGKDSTATLVRALELNFTPLAFTFDTGYYPPHIVPRARAAAGKAGADHEVIDLRQHVRPTDLESFSLTADLYDLPENADTAAVFRRLYEQGRRAFSVRNDEPMAYVRTCQLCRRLVVRAYHREATHRGVRVIILGTNEWVGLSQDPSRTGYRFSAIRRLKPPGTDHPVYVVHLPFLLHTTIDDTRAILDRIGWTEPDGEDLVESCANSCLLSRAAEAKATRLLGFHPDTTRLAREVTAGFLTRDQATTALARPHEHPRTVRAVLADAAIL